MDFPTEGLEQHRLSFAVRDAPRLQIKHLLGIERTDCRAVSANNIVGEDLQLRLLIHLSAGRQENGLRFHRPIGLLRRSLYDDLSLKDPNRVIVDDCTIEFAARPARGGV